MLQLDARSVQACSWRFFVDYLVELYMPAPAVFLVYPVPFICCFLEFSSDFLFVIYYLPRGSSVFPPSLCFFHFVGLFSCSRPTQS